MERAGRWTLQRLVQEITPPRAVAFDSDDSAAASLESVEVLEHVQIDALDVTIVRGGGTEVAAWAEDQGFTISADAPEVLDFYSDRSPYFMAARFDADLAAADDFTEGDAIPVHLAIPTEDPWVPIHILGLDKPGTEVVEADVFLLTDEKPSLLGPKRCASSAPSLPRTCSSTTCARTGTGVGARGGVAELPAHRRPGGGAGR